MMMTARVGLSLVAAVMVGWVTGCGAEVLVADVGGGGASTSSGAGGGSSSSGSGGAGGTAGAGGCSSYADEEGAGQVTFRFINNSGLPIYLPALCGNLPLDVRPTSGDDGIDYAFDPFCLQTCEDLQSSGFIDCAMCEPTSIYLAPNDAYEVTWNGTGLAPTVMPDQCWMEEGNYGGGCGQIVQAAAQSYRISATGYSSCGDSYSTCGCDGDGLCDGDAYGDEATADVTDFAYAENGALLVEVLFGVCAYGCP
jgi:hypothetical protein